MTDKQLLQWTYERLLAEYPYAGDFFSAVALSPQSSQQTVGELLREQNLRQEENQGGDPSEVVGQFLAFMEKMAQLQSGRMNGVNCLSISGGRNKDGLAVEADLELRAGEIICVVGPTGAGKSLLLSDIECLAQGDTPSGRCVCIDHRTQEDRERLSGEQRLVAQLSQNMNFVMDVSVREFLQMHAECRLLEDIDGIAARVFETAVRLAGEPFTADTPVTALSGGQSRALMIADVAGLSASPIVLIDEIENAGVDRRKALDLLMGAGKIVIMATHDPLLALSGHRRMAIRNGAVAAVLKTSREEKELLKKLDAVDQRIAALRRRIRGGEKLTAESFWEPV